MFKDTFFSIRFLSSSDIEKVLSFKLKNRSFLQPFQPIQSDNVFTIEEQTKWVGSVIRNNQLDKGYSFGIFTNDDNQLIGIINLSNVSRGIFQNCYLGYSLDEDFNSRGIMTKALNWIVDYAFNVLSFHRIQAAVMPSNISSIRVLEKCSFNKIGLAEKYLKINGTWEDHLLFEIVHSV